MTHDLLLTEEKPGRRGFLRSLIMAPAALATHKFILPAQRIITPGDAEARLARHIEGAKAAIIDLFPPEKQFLSGLLDGYHFHCRELIARGVDRSTACATIATGATRGRR